MSKAVFLYSEVLTHLKRECECAGSQRAYAKQAGFSPAYINDVVNGKREFSAKLARALGYDRIIVFRRR